ncbi:hypothetical protein E2C01_073168 [Portunus trituberculatus]|uniref:Uncharacterized protein n=1 Tax=Portunus trituberculatus TaxID=210409 RepID=A0A5B7I956_PORTR|nr:hypothetical protein [Portunus trituberculatus]
MELPDPPPSIGLEEFGISVPPETKPIALADPLNAALEPPSDPPPKEGLADVEAPSDTLDDPTCEEFDPFTNDIIGRRDDSGVGGRPRRDDIGPRFAESPPSRSDEGSEDIREPLSSSSEAVDGLKEGQSPNNDDVRVPVILVLFTCVS